MASSFETAAPQILKAIRAGATIDAAATEAGVKVRTVRDWAYRGRKDASGRYGAFARALDGARHGQRTLRLSDAEESALADKPMTHEEIDRRLTVAIRRDYLPAMRLWLDIHPREDEPQQDELSWLQED
jgi:transposase